MRTKSFILGGVAVAGLFSVTPALAYTRHPGTPAEHQQTEDLNQQQLNQAQAGSTTQVAATTTAPAQTMASSTPVNALANPPQALANASVETSSGQAVGAVQKVILDAGGKAKTVIVALLGKVNKVVAIAANELTFDESRNVVVAQLSADQIDSLPAAPQS
jgi:hypothetical protein